MEYVLISIKAPIKYSDAAETSSRTILMELIAK